MAKREFDDWFSEQFGPRPTSIQTPRLIEKARALEEEAKATRELIRRANEWEEQRRASRYAWTVWQRGEGK